MIKIAIRMTRATNGADDGVTVKSYQEGEVYEVGEDLARAFVDEMKVASRVDAPTEAPPEAEPAAGDDADLDTPAPKKRAKKRTEAGE